MRKARKSQTVVFDSICLLVSLFFAFVTIWGITEYIHEINSIPNETADYDYEDLTAAISSSSQTSGEPTPLFSYDADALLKINSDFKGWLFIPDTLIDLPVVQGTDNSYYLDHSFKKAASKYGCPFITANTPVDAQNRVIHGHNMGNNREEIFSTLVLYQDQNYAEKHDLIYFSEPSNEDNCTYRLFAVLNFNTNQQDGYIYYTKTNFSSQDEYDSLVGKLRERSLYQTSFVPTEDLLILSTCNRRAEGGKDNRLLICAARVHG